MNVTKLKIIAENGKTLAYLYPGETDWLDPYGGYFTDEEQAQFGTVARGHEQVVHLGAGTKFSKHVAVRFAVEF